MKKEILDFLDKHTSFLATKGTCGNPRVRPVQSFVLKDGVLYGCSGKSKGLVKHLQNFSNAEICAYDGVETWIRIRAVVEFADDMEVKAQMFQKYPLLSKIYGSAENEEFVVFAFRNPSIKIQSLSGKEEVIKE